MNARKWRFPVLIGAGVIAAGVLLYHSNSRIDSSQTRGTIAQRDVYRDSQVNPDDVKATPGHAPVAAKVLLESKEFKTLAKNPAYHDLLASASFEALAQNEEFLALLSNPAFADIAKNGVFADYLSSDALTQALKKLSAEEAQAAKANLSSAVKWSASQQAAKKLSADVHPQELSAEVKPQLDVNVVQAVHATLAAANASELAQSQAFNSLMADANFLSLLKTQGTRQDLARLVSAGSFAVLVHNSELQSVLSGSEFQEALRSGIKSSARQSLAKF